MEINVRQQYNQMAATYDRRWHRYISRTLSFLQNWANISATEIVLDIGCGTGELERLLLETHSNQQIVGVDLSEQMLAIARQKCQSYAHVAFHLASATALPFDDHSYDRVVSASSFHYFDAPQTALIEIKRVLKPTGTLVVLDWCKDYWLCRIYDWVLKRVDPAYRQCYTQREFHALLADAGFEILASERVRFGIAWELMITSAQEVK